MRYAHAGPALPNLTGLQGGPRSSIRRMNSPALAALLCVASSLSAFGTQIIAHRGASFDAPENTLAALRLGYEQGADACELDCHLSKDGHVVVSHDASTKRATGHDAPIVTQTLAELRALDAGSWKGARWAGEKIPTLAEALAIVPDGKQLFIEVKCGPEILPALQRDIAASGRPHAQLVIISFNFAVVQQARALLPLIDAYFLASYKRDKEFNYPRLENLIAKAKSAGLTGLDLAWRFPIDAATVAALREADLKLQVWTVDDPAVARRLAAAGVTGITTNRPAWLRAQLK